MLGSLLCSLSIASQAVLYAPLNLSTEIASIESTKLDIGESSAIFDANDKTLTRTASVNPATVRVEFKKPVSFRAVRLLTTGDLHEASLRSANSMDDLKAGKGSLIFGGRRFEGGTLLVELPSEARAQAFQLDLRRLAGDDYVHIYDLQLCVPGRAEGLRVFRSIDRRDPQKTQSADKPIEVPIDTVVKFGAAAKVNGTEMDVSDSVKWSSRTLKPFGKANGEFWVDKPGKHVLEARYGSAVQKIDIVGKPRQTEKRGFDLEVLYLERTPRIDYDGPNNGLPEPGQTVKWVGHVRNWGAIPVKFTYEWLVDGKPVANGLADAGAGRESQVVYSEKWTPKRRDLTLKVLPTVRMMELIQANNELTVQTDAVTVGLWVERSLWDFMHEHQYKLPTKDANSFAGWAQRMMRQWNTMFKEAVYKDFPNGITERVRLDKIVVVPDFALPLAGGVPSNNPDLRDKTVDMTWGMEGSEVAPGVKVGKSHWWSPERAIEALNNGDVARRKADPPFWCGLGYIHEMNHARYLVDSYGFNVHSDTGPDRSKWSIQVEDEKGPIMGRYIPLKGDLVWSQKHVGHMGGDYWKFSAFEAMCWNRVQGRRARGGNCNSPSTIGEFLNDIPKQVVLRFIDPSGNPLAGAQVWAYRARGTGNGWYSKLYENQPAIKTAADGQGRAVFDRTLWSADGKIQHTYGISQSVALLRVTHNGQNYYLFECVADSNIAYNLGRKDMALFKRVIPIRNGEPSPEEWSPFQTWEVPGEGFETRPEGWKVISR